MAEAENGLEGGRERQRRRTRKAIVDAAKRLLSDGRTPSVAEVAEAADVSRRTVYTYFPTLDQLFVDAALDGSRQEVERALVETGTIEERVDSLVRAMWADSRRTEMLGRKLISLTATGPSDEINGVPRRGYRRVEWIGAALAPLRERMDEPSYERLVSALSLVVGWEAMLVLRDLRGLDPAAEIDVSTWAARALLTAALKDLDERAC
jgi:AcrR family transcriptional regulator